MRPLVPAKSGGWLGVAAIAAWVVLYVTAAVPYVGYDLTTNYLSDLGHPQAPAAWAFNAGAILGGILFVPFALALGRALGGRLGTAGGFLLLIAAVFLILVGVFPESSPNNLHFIVSAGFFLTTLISALVLAIPLHVSKAFGPMSGLLSGAVIAASVVLLATFAPLYEHITVYLALVWAAWNAMRLLRIPVAATVAAPAAA